MLPELRILISARVHELLVGTIGHFGAIDEKRWYLRRIERKADQSDQKNAAINLDHVCGRDVYSG